MKKEEQNFWSLRQNRSIVYFLEIMQLKRFGINCVKELFRKKERGLGIDKHLRYSRIVNYRKVQLFENIG